MRLFSSSFLTLTLLSLQPAHAENTTSSDIGVPSLGFVYDSSVRAVRPILGTPGAAVLGGPLDFGFRLADASIAAHDRFVLAASADDHQVRLVRVQNGRVTVQLIDNALASPDLLILSPSGRAAVLYKHTDNCGQVVTGLPDAPVVATEFSTAGLAGRAINAALSDDGRFVLFVAGDRNMSSVWLLDVNAGLSRLPLPTSTAVVAFRPNSREALAVTRTGELYLLADGGAISQQGIITGDQTADPVGVQFSTDGRRAYVAYSQGFIATVDSSTGVTTTISCGCTPTGLHLLVSSKMYRLNEPSTFPLQLLDVSTTDPRMWFIPPDRTSSDVPRSEQ